MKTQQEQARANSWAALSQQRWDVIVIGGGITGAGVAREAVRRGQKTVLIEQTDYAWGTSSRSSKMVHGGLRYIAMGEIRMTWHSLTERERLLREAPGLVTRMGYYFAHFRGVFPGRWPFAVLLIAYNVLAGVRDHRFFKTKTFLKHMPGYRDEGLTGASRYSDALTDDARLVQRVLDEAKADGLCCLNYVRAKDLMLVNGRVAGLHIENSVSGQEAAMTAKVVINATGAWADRLRRQLVDEVRVRPLRGSHLVFSAAQLPLAEAIICHHPDDARVMFIYPWEGRSIVGTTDLDHDQDLDEEAVLNLDELNYLLRGVNASFPALSLTRNDVIATWSGVRPVVSAGSGSDPSHESRGHSVWDNNGLITVTGGKLTTFRLIALDALKLASSYLAIHVRDDKAPTFATVPALSIPATLSDEHSQRLLMRYGQQAAQFIAEMPAVEFVPIADTSTLLAELRWACRYEQVVHLDDLLLRRVRVGLLLKDGGLAHMPALDTILGQELGWCADTIAHERQRYLSIWTRFYYLPAA